MNCSRSRRIEKKGWKNTHHIAHIASAISSGLLVRRNHSFPICWESRSLRTREASLFYFSQGSVSCDVRFASDYPTPVPRAYNQYQSWGEHRRKVSLPEPLRASSPPRNPHFDQCEHVKTVWDKTMFETIPTALDFYDI